MPGLQDAMSPPGAILLIYQNVTAVRRGQAAARDGREGNLSEVLPILFVLPEKQTLAN